MALTLDQTIAKQGTNWSSRLLSSQAFWVFIAIVLACIYLSFASKAFLTPQNAFKALGTWRDWGRQAGVQVEVMTQFCFESAPIVGWIGELQAHGGGVPVVVGLAGPATPATLIKFALRCGIGNSIRSMRNQIGRYGRLLTDAGPDDVVCGLQSSFEKSKASIAGLHLFPFGGLRKAGDWRRSYSQLAPRPSERAAPVGDYEKQ